jgi:hypothetical protein
VSCNAEKEHDVGERAGQDVVTYASHLLSSVAADGITARLLGGVAIAMRCGSARHAPLERVYHDLDLMTTRADSRRLSDVLVRAGFQPNARFNALHGRSRLIFTSSEGMHLDVLVGEFAMCHKLDLTKRLSIHDRTLSLADLALTKLQIAELNIKDAQDLAALFLDHELTDDEAGVNAEYLAELLAHDWGWWRTVTANLELLERHLEAVGLRNAEAQRILARVEGLRQAITTAKKSFGWKSRARIGDRLPWRDEPEEITPH